MAEIEHLEVVIDVIESFEKELDKLLFQLGLVETAVSAVDPIKIDVKIKGEEKLDALVAHMQALDALDDDGLVGDFVVGDKTVRRGGGGGRARLGRDTRQNMEGLVDEISDMTRTLSNSFEGISDSSGGASKSLSGTAEAAEEASEGLFKMDLRMTDLHNALARIVPLLLVVIGALPAVIGGFIAVAGAALAAAAALASLTAFGALGAAIARGGVDNIGEGFMEMLREVRDDFLDAFRPLAERLAPLFEDALDGLDKLFQAIANEGDALVALQEEARAFGQWVLDTLPSFLGDLARFVDAMSDAFDVMVAGFDNFNLFQALAGFIAEVLPPLLNFTGLVAALVPHLLDMSIGFLRVTNGILFVMNGILDLLTLFGTFDQGLGLVIGTLLAAWTATMLLNSAMVTKLASAVVAAGSRLIWLAQVNRGLAVSYIQAKVGADMLTGALVTLRAAIIGLLAVTGIGLLIAAVGTLASNFLTASGSIDQATDSLKAFQRQQSRMTSGRNPYADPDLKGRAVSGRSRFAGGGQVNVTIEGNADPETVRNQTQNALYRMERPRRSR